MVYASLFRSMGGSDVDLGFVFLWFLAKIFHFSKRVLTSVLISLFHLRKSAKRHSRFDRRYNGFWMVSSARAPRSTARALILHRFYNGFQISIFIFPEMRFILIFNMSN